MQTASIYLTTDYIKRDLSYFDIRAPGSQMTHRNNLDSPQSEIETETK
jgi:hypothetical protein